MLNGLISDSCCLHIKIERNTIFRHIFVTNVHHVCTTCSIYLVAVTQHIMLISYADLCTWVLYRMQAFLTCLYLFVCLALITFEQRRRCRAQQLLAQSSEALAEAVSLCLHHKLPLSILADASLNMFECHGQLDPALAGQHLALFQVLCTRSLSAFVQSFECSLQCLFSE